MLAAFDDRIIAAVASCGYATVQGGEGPHSAGPATTGSATCPSFGRCSMRGRLPHWDWDDVLRLAAPRAVYQYNTKEDQIFPESASAFEAGEAAREIWSLYGQQDRLINVLRPGKHAIAEQDKQEMYEWLDRQLKGKGLSDR